jgi:hypothetical protein
MLCFGLILGTFFLFWITVAIAAACHHETTGNTIAAIGLLIFLSSIGFTTYEAYRGTVYTETTDVQLAAFANGNGVTGSFFLGSGFVSGILTYKYVFYPDPKDKHTFQADSIIAHNVKIIQDNKVQPMFRTIKKYKKYTDYWKYEYTFYIPENSIKEIYSLDVSR